MFLIQSFFGGGLEIVLMLSAVIGIIINYKNSKKNNNKNIEDKSDIENNKIESNNKSLNNLEQNK